MSLDAYLALVRDQARMAAYCRAVERAVRADDVVIDLGAGLGVLAVVAARRGAIVYAVDSDPVVHRVNDLARANGVADRVHVLQGSSLDLDPPEPADVLVYDDFNVLDLGGAMPRSLRDARERWLKPDARVVPPELELWAVPLARLPKSVSSVADDLPLDLDRIRQLARETPRPIKLDSERAFAARARVVARAQPECLAGDGLEVRGRFRAVRSGRVRGILCWLKLRFGSRHHLDTGPGSPPTAYPQLLLPFTEMESPKMGEGGVIEVAVRHRVAMGKGADHRLWWWEVSTTAGTAKGSTFANMLLTST